MRRRVVFIATILAGAHCASFVINADSEPHERRIQLAQYENGPPIWPRDPDRYRDVPLGPQMEPCIYRGDCRGQRLPPGYYEPRYRRRRDDDPPRMPPFPDRY